MKLTFEDKKQIYAEWKEDRKGMNSTAQSRHLNAAFFRYMIRLADRYGVDILKHKWNYYSPEFKESAIKRVLLHHEAAFQVSLDLALSNHGTMIRWIKEYVANSYTVIEKKKGRKRNGSQTQEDSRETRKGTEIPEGRKSSSFKEEQRASEEERDSYDTDRILIKLDASVSKKEKSEKQKPHRQ